MFCKSAQEGVKWKAIQTPDENMDIAHAFISALYCSYFWLLRTECAWILTLRFCLGDCLLKSRKTKKGLFSVILPPSFFSPFIIKLFILQNTSKHNPWVKWQVFYFIRWIWHDLMCFLAVWVYPLVLTLLKRLLQVHTRIKSKMQHMQLYPLNPHTPTGL